MLRTRLGQSVRAAMLGVALGCAVWNPHVAGGHESGPVEGEPSSVPVESTPPPALPTASPVPSSIPVPAPSPPPKSPPTPWKGVFFDNDFSVKQDPNHAWLLGEDFKDLPVDDWLDWLEEPALFSAGGEERYRMINEANRLRPVPPGVRNLATYNQWRYRQYLDLKYSDAARIYFELLDGAMFDNPLTVTGIDQDRWEIQNFFIDVKLAERDEKPVYVRVGRQELLYGSQRLLSPLDWANIRRNFQGIKVFSRGTEWDLDAWSTFPVNTATFGNGQVLANDGSINNANTNHTFSGIWWTYKAIQDQTWDLYWFWDWNKEVIQPHYPGGNRHTFATRWLASFPVTEYGKVDRTWLAEVEGGYQTGDDFGRVVNAGFCTVGLGRQWTARRWQPTLWGYFDWASGSRDFNGGTTQTFSQQYGLVHAFLGQIDNLARQNIMDLNGKFSVTPVRQLVIETQVHYFNLQNDNDVLYIITGQPFGEPGRGRHVGEEVDVLLTYTYNPNFNIQVGYFHFWYGEFVENNSPRPNAWMFYVMPTLRF